METAVIDRPPPTGEGLTFEKVWAAIQESGREFDRKMQEIRETMKETDRQMKENAEARKETDRQIKETSEQMKETDRQIKETSEQMKETDRQMKETSEQMKETDRQMKETDRKMKETDKKFGELNNRFGELAEHLVAPGIAQRFNELGHHFDGIASGGYKISDGQGKIIAEVDLLLENGDCIMAVEVKVKPRAKYIEQHIQRLEILRKHRSTKGDKRKIYGAIAGAIFGPTIKQLVINAGFYVLEQSGDTMKMDIPTGFVPREF